ncbi:hypothetical protein ACXHQN_01710 [Vibrio cincinnatiensis]
MSYIFKSDRDLIAFHHFSMMKNKKSMTKKDLLKECDDLVNHFIYREKEEKILQMAKGIVDDILDYNATLQECIKVKRELSKTIIDEMEDTREIKFESDIDNIIEFFIKIYSLSLIPKDLYDDMIELLENFKKAFNEKRGVIKE